VSWNNGDAAQAAADNATAWGLMDGTVTKEYVASLNLLHDSSGVLIYIWDGNTATTNGLWNGEAPQIMFAETPEPNSLLLLGTGLLAFASFLYYKRHGAVGSF
jgi:hypothetical protein